MSIWFFLIGLYATPISASSSTVCTTSQPVCAYSYYPSHRFGFTGAVSVCSGSEQVPILAFNGIEYSNPARGMPSVDLLGPVADATYINFAPSCMSLDRDVIPTIWGPPVVEDERCNVLNVLQPADNSGPKKPVLIYFHGGSSMSGSIATANIDLRKVAADSDFIVVEAQYRLGLVGFVRADLDMTKMSPAESDALAVLRWVQQHLTKLAPNADLSNVMIGGQSHGALIVAQLTLLAETKSLYNKVWMNSIPVGIPSHSAQKVQDIFTTVISSSGCVNNFNTCYQLLPISKLMQIQGMMMLDIIPSITTTRSYGALELFAAYRPTQSGGFKNVYERLLNLEGNPGKPTLFTFNRDEGAFGVDMVFTGQVAAYPSLAVPGLLATVFGGQANVDAVRKLYPAVSGNEPGPWQALLDSILSDSIFGVPIMSIASAMNHGGRTAYVYHSTQALNPGCVAISPRCSNTGLSCHSDDLLGTLDNFYVSSVFRNWHDSCGLLARGGACS